MLFCIPGCGICIPLESFLPLILVFLWNPIAKFFGFAQTTEGKVRIDPLLLPLGNLY